MLRFDVFTLFPEVMQPYLQTSILLRAQQRGLLEVRLHNIRDWTADRHHVTDDEDPAAAQLLDDGAQVLHGGVGITAVATQQTESRDGYGPASSA